MAVSTNYPLMFHCNIGTDRTGFISFIVNALLGVEEELLYRDYMMSNYADIGNTRDIASISTYISQLRNNYEGSSDLSVGAKNYMLSIGVSEANINSIKNIMLGE
jgi:protein tyrosine/serine phosphatase